MDMKKFLQAVDGAVKKPAEGSNDMKKFLRVVYESNLNQKEAVGDFSADPAQQAKRYLQFHSGLYDPSTLPPTMSITPSLSLAVQSPTNFKGSHEEILANMSAANKRLPKEFQVSWDELKQLGGVSDTIALTGEPHPDKYNPATDPTDTDPVATPFKVNEEVGMSRFLSIVTEGKGPLNRLTQAESIAVQHFQSPHNKTITNPVLNVAEGAKPSMIGKYFKQVEQELAESAERSKARSQQLAKVVSKRIAERISLPDPNDPDAQQKIDSQIANKQAMSQQLSAQAGQPPKGTNFSKDYLEKAASGAPGRWMISADDAKVALDWLSKNPSPAAPATAPAEPAATMPGKDLLKAEKADKQAGTITVSGKEYKMVMLEPGGIRPRGGQRIAIPQAVMGERGIGNYIGVLAGSTVYVLPKGEQ